MLQVIDAALVEVIGRFPVAKLTYALIPNLYKMTRRRVLPLARRLMLDASLTEEVDAEQLAAPEQEHEPRLRDVLDSPLAKGLEPVDRQILELAAEGKSDGEIAKVVSMSRSRVCERRQAAIELLAKRARKEL